MLLRLSILQLQLSEKQEALKNCEEALEMMNRSLAIAPNDNSVYNRRNLLKKFLDDFGEDTVSS